MLKKRFAFLTVLLLCAVLVLCVQADTYRLVDNADLLSFAEAAEIEELLDDISGRMDMDIVIVTADSLDGKSAMAYADDFYDYNGYDPDGVLLLVSMTEWEWWISTSGKAIQSVTDSEIDSLSGQFLPELSNGDYISAFSQFAKGIEAAAESSGDGISLMSVFVCLIIGVAAACIATWAMKAQLKTVRRQNTANSYVLAGSLHLTQSRDIYLYRNITRVAKPQNNGSGTHRGSSGRSHGGRGGRF